MTSWNTDKTGNISVRPLTGFGTALFAQIACGLRLTYLLPGPAKEEKALQLALTPPQARELGEALLKMADQAEAQDLGRAQ